MTMRKQKLGHTSAADRTVAENIKFAVTVSFILLVVIKLSALFEELIVDERKVTRAHSLVVEAIRVPLNGDTPVYTENEFTKWVTVTVSGSVERDGEFYLDGLFHYHDKQRYAETLFINGAWAFEWQSVEEQFPDYNDDHFYRFIHWVDADSWEQLGFEFLDADATDLDGVFTVEIANTPYYGRPEAGGR